MKLSLLAAPLLAGLLSIAPAPSAALLALAPAPPWSGLPVRTSAAHGLAGDPVNIAFEGSQAGILAAFVKIGWLKADSLSVKDDARLATDAVFHRLYPTAPVSNLYLFGRSEAFAVERELGSVSRRDHARFWNSGRVDRATGLALWVGDASRDIAVEVLRRHGIPVGTTHRIDPNLDAERDLIVSSLRAAGLVAAVVTEPGMGRTTNGRNGGGDLFRTDGLVKLVVLAHP